MATTILDAVKRAAQAAAADGADVTATVFVLPTTDGLRVMAERDRVTPTYSDAARDQLAGPHVPEPSLHERLVAAARAAEKRQPVVELVAEQVVRLTEDAHQLERSAARHQEQAALDLAAANEKLAAGQELLTALAAMGRQL